MNLETLVKNLTGRTVYDYKIQYIREWLSWYTGYVKAFHDYTIFNGKKEISMRRKSLSMAKKVCEDWADLLINEKTDITLSDELSQTNLETILKNTSFWSKANRGIEKTFALGGGAFVVSVENMEANEAGEITNRGAVNVTFVNALSIQPVTVVDDEITECAFISQVGTKRYNIQIHLLNEMGNYEIWNIAATGETRDNLTYSDNDVYIFDTKSNVKWFYYLKPNITNNIDIDSPCGLSVFANAIDVLKEIDIIYDSYANEFALGRKRIFANAKQFTIDPVTGQQVEVFDSNDVVIYTLPEDVDGKTIMQDMTQALRVSEHEEGLQGQLNKLSAACGFGTEHYRFGATGASTATEIVSENSAMFRTIKKHEILVEECLIRLVEAISYASNTFGTLPILAENIAVKFDDSIIEDRNAERETDRTDVAMGVMSKAEYRAKWYAEPIEEAEAKIDEINAVTINDVDG